MSGTFYSWVSIVERALREEGVDLRGELALQGVAIPRDPTSRLDVATTRAIWRVADRHTLPPAFGIRIARGLTYGHFEDLGVALASVSSMEDAIRHIVRYHRLLTDQVRVSVTSDERRIVIELADEGTDHWRVHEFAAAIVVRVVRARFGRGIDPLSVSLAVDSPEAYTAYRRYFKCPVHQRVPASEVVFAAELPGQSDVGPLGVADRIEALLDAAYRDMEASTTWSRQVHAAVLRAPAGQMTSIDHVAAQFHVSARTLQRHLASESTSFRQIVDLARKDLAMRLVREGILTLSQIADTLGFQSASAFSQSFRRWYGLPPSRVRDKPPADDAPEARLRRRDRCAG